MAYIRCFSNPEGLYVWHDIAGHIAITHCRKKPFASKEGFVDEQFHVPLKEWYGLFANLYDHHNGQVTDIKYGDFSIKEERINSKTGEIVPDDINLEKLSKIDYTEQYKISYKKDFVYVWQVTLQYLANNVIRDISNRRLKQK